MSSSTSEQHTASGAPRYAFADLVLDVGTRELKRGEDVVPLGHLTYKLLVALVRLAPNVVSHDELIERVWGGRSTTPETVTQRVKLLRDALGDDADRPRYVGLVRHQGYRLIPPVETAPHTAASDTPLTSTRGAGESRARWAAVAIATTVLVAAAGAALWLGRSVPPPGAPLPLAVLPLAELSTGGSQEYFAEGMTEALIASLAKLGGLSVISRTSTMRYKDTAKSVPEIARELGVAAVLEGSAQLEGNRVRVTAQLIDARTDRHVWAETFERELEDVLALQSEIARTVAEKIEVVVTPEESGRLGRGRKVDPETFRAYLRGMYHLNRGARDDVAAGLTYLHEAVDRDPGDALAYAGLALGYATLGHGPAPQADAWPLARAAALRAIALDPNLAEAHAALADVKLYMEWDWAGAEQAFLRARELAPSLAMNHYHYAWYLALFDRWDEAVAAHKRAAELDPLTPLHVLWLGGLYLYDHLGRHAEALVEAERALALSPENPTALMILGRALSAAGRHDEAVAVHRRMAELNADLLWQLGLTLAMAGRLDETRAILAQVAAQPESSWTAFGRAMLHAQLDELDAAFQWLAYEPPHAWLPWIRTDPWLRPRLEHDPRFDALLARLGLPR